ncbi:MAG: ThuA domain-containing protein, partial [Bacteroidetes bacterium]|nr:ThuA domain-containing protein [Bacteroidota bacterium]
VQHIHQGTENLKKKPYIVFLITEDTNNYEAHKTIPLFADMFEKEHGYTCKVILGKGTHGAYSYPDLKPLDKADLLVVFARRIALPHDQMKAIKNYLNKGKPLVGIRTANHAFKVNGKIEDGFEDWPGFVADILGCENRGYGSAELGTDVTIDAEAGDHPVLNGVQSAQWHSTGQIYHVAPLLDKDAKILLWGKVENKTEPIAWTRKAGKSKVFYTSLGHPDDFKVTSFLTLLINGIKWSLAKEGAKL